MHRRGVRFLPAADYHHVDGQADPTLTFRAWDRSNAVADSLDGTLADASTYGGTSPYSNEFANVTITVNAVNTAPTVVISEASYAAVEQSELALHGTGISIDDVDAGDAAVQATLTITFGTLTIDAGTTGVTITGSGTGQVMLTGAVAEINALLAGESGGTMVYIADSNTPPTSAELTLAVDDLGNSGVGDPLTAESTVTIQINQLNDAPTAGTDVLIISPDLSVSFNESVLTGNDGDPDGPIPSIIDFTQPGHGSLVRETDGSFTYTPSSGFTGGDSFHYSVGDGELTATATVWLEVGPLVTTAVGASMLVMDAGGTLGLMVTRDHIHGEQATYFRFTSAQGTIAVGGSQIDPATNVASQPAGTNFTFTPSSEFHGTAGIAIQPGVLNSDGNFVAVGGAYNAVVVVNQVALRPLLRVLNADVHEGDGQVTITVRRSFAGAEAVSVNWALVDETAQHTAEPTSDQQFDYGGVWDPTPWTDYTTEHGYDLTTTTTTYVTVYWNNAYSIPEPYIAGYDYQYYDENGDLQSGYSPGTNVDESWVSSSPRMETYYRDILAGAESSEDGPDSKWTNGYNVTSEPRTTTVTAFVARDTPDETWSSPPSGITYSWIERDLQIPHLHAGTWTSDAMLNGTITFAAGDSRLEQTFTLHVHDDAFVEGTEKFRVVLSNPTNGTIGSDSTGTVRIVDNEHVPEDDSYSLEEDSVLVLDAANGVIANDSEFQGTGAVATLVNQAAHGIVTLAADGSFTYAPEADYFGTDSFSYSVTGSVAPAYVTITVTSQNDAPQVTNALSAALDAAVDDMISEGGVLLRNILPTGLIVDVDGPVTGIAVTDLEASEGVWEYRLSIATAWMPLQDGVTELSETSAHLLAADTSTRIRFVPSGTFTTITLKYVAWDGSAGSIGALADASQRGSDTAFSEDSVTAQVHPITAQDDRLIAAPGATATSVFSVLGNDGDALKPTTAIVHTSPQHGLLAFHPDGTFEYTPELGYLGDDEFQYVALRGSHRSEPTSVKITVADEFAGGTVGEQPLVAQHDAGQTPEGTPVYISSSWLLSNDATLTGQPNFAVVTSHPQFGSLAPADGGFTYRPTQGFVGVDSFTYRIVSGNQISAEATVAVNVTAVPAPLLTDIRSPTIEEGSAFTILGSLLHPEDRVVDAYIVWHWEDSNGPQTSTTTLQLTSNGVLEPFSAGKDLKFVYDERDSYKYRAEIRLVDRFSGKFNTYEVVPTFARDRSLGLQLSTDTFTKTLSLGSGSFSVDLSGTLTDLGVDDVATVTVAWGDGTSSQVDVRGSDNSLSLSHQYVNNGRYSGTYRAQMFAVDRSGNLAEKAVSITYATNWSLGVSLEAITEGLTSKLAFDYEVLNPGGEYEVTIDWGDGTTETIQHQYFKQFVHYHQYRQDTVIGTVPEENVSTLSVTLRDVSDDVPEGHREYHTGGVFDLAVNPPLPDAYGYITAQSTSTEGGVTTYHATLHVTVDVYDANLDDDITVSLRDISNADSETFSAAAVDGVATFDIQLSSQFWGNSWMFNVAAEDDDAGRSGPNYLYVSMGINVDEETGETTANWDVSRQAVQGWDAETYYSKYEPDAIPPEQLDLGVYFREQYNDPAPIETVNVDSETELTAAGHADIIVHRGSGHLTGTTVVYYRLDFDAVEVLPNGQQVDRSFSEIRSAAILEGKDEVRVTVDRPTISGNPQITVTATLLTEPDQLRTKYFSPSTNYTPTGNPARFTFLGAMSDSMTIGLHQDATHPSDRQAVGEGAVVADVQNGDVQLTFDPAMVGFAPTYQGGENLVPIAQLTTKLSSLIDGPAQLRARMIIGDVYGDYVTFASVDPTQLTQAIRLNVPFLETADHDGTLSSLPSGNYRAYIELEIKVGDKTFVRMFEQEFDFANRVNADVGFAEFGANWSLPILDRLVFNTGYEALPTEFNAVGEPSITLLRGDGSHESFALQTQSVATTIDYDAPSDWDRFPANTMWAPEYLYSDGSSSSEAIWTISGLQQNKLYAVEAAWRVNPALGENAQDAQYAVEAGRQLIGGRLSAAPAEGEEASTFTVTANQRAGTNRILGYFLADADGQIVVRLSGTAGGVVTAAEQDVAVKEVCYADNSSDLGNNGWLELSADNDAPAQDRLQYRIQRQ